MTHALILNEDEDRKVHASVKAVSPADLPDPDGKGRDVLVKVKHSTINYKDGMVVKGIGRLVKSYPHIPGIDFAGEVMESNHPDYQAGDEVVLTGWRVGEFFNGGLSNVARVNGDWLVPLPQGLSAAEAMAVGTAGFTAMLAIHQLEQQGLTPNGDLPILVSGATGGVGSIAVSLLHHLGYQVTAVTGKASAKDYLTMLGANSIIMRETLNEPEKRPLEKECWAGAIDAVGGVMLSRILAQTQYGGSVAAIGLAGGNQMAGTVLPFLLRGVHQYSR